MQRSGKKFLVVFVSFFILLSLVAGSAYATNGYFAHGYSIKNKALAGAGTALPLDTLAASTNPAGMVFVGDRADAVISFFSPHREYTVSGAPGFLSLGKGESGSELFVIPGFGYNKMMNENYSLGISIYGNGGMNTDYDSVVYPGGSSPTGVDLSQLFVVATYARKLTPEHAIGVSPIFALQYFEAKGLGGFAMFSSDPDSLTDNGHDSEAGFGLRVGYLGEIMPGLFFGASYQSRIFMAELEEYEGLFAEHGDFDIPSTWNVGIAYEINPDLTIAFDIQQIYYSEVDSVGNNFDAMSDCMAGLAVPLPASEIDECLGNAEGPGFGWEDMTVFKVGIQWDSNEETTWRAGYSYAEQPIPDSEVLLNILAPGVIEQHITGGVTLGFANNQEVDLAVMYALRNDVTGPLPSMFGGGQTIELQMDQWEFSIGYSKSF